MKRLITLLFGLLILFRVANAQTVAVPPTPSSADSTNLSAYTGAYSFVSGSPIQKFTVTSAKGELFGEADGYGKNKLVKQPKADTYQSTSSYGSVITFGRDAATKAVTGLTMTVQGTDLAAKKDNP